MTDKFYADRPDKDAVEVGYVTGAADSCWGVDKGVFHNKSLNLTYTPRAWWKFWAPAYEVKFNGDDNV